MTPLYTMQSPCRRFFLLYYYYLVRLKRKNSILDLHFLCITADLLSVWRLMWYFYHIALPDRHYYFSAEKAQSNCISSSPSMQMSQPWYGQQGHKNPGLKRGAVWAGRLVRREAVWRRMRGERMQSFPPECQAVGNSWVVVTAAALRSNVPLLSTGLGMCSASGKWSLSLAIITLRRLFPSRRESHWCLMCVGYKAWFMLYQRCFWETAWNTQAVYQTWRAG